MVLRKMRHGVADPVTGVFLMVVKVWNKWLIYFLFLFYLITTHTLSLAFSLLLFSPRFSLSPLILCAVRGTILSHSSVGAVRGAFLFISPCSLFPFLLWVSRGIRRRSSWVSSSRIWRCRLRVVARRGGGGGGGGGGELLRVFECLSDLSVRWL